MRAIAYLGLTDALYFFQQLCCNPATKITYGGAVGPLATVDCEPRQVRKEAAVAIDSCAEVWLTGLPPHDS